MTNADKLNEAQALLRRAQKHLLAWAKWYGDHDGRHCRCGVGVPLPLPPAGDVRLAEDIDDSLMPSPVYSYKTDSAGKPFVVFENFDECMALERSK